MYARKDKRPFISQCVARMSTDSRRLRTTGVIDELKRISMEKSSGREGLLETTKIFTFEPRLESQTTRNK
jgi:hypothetical protein